ncbi:hypothetical protein Cob_v002516 [Colletotrichum orbiculare MAFF 240422]|uniref:Heterokaryon incompatibility domain-containing protein n=1 Tax=Colletotrichum orbiculare (strain 104-T / ATCC 96160 / CBS 514.97 / LARS 414 / MAFF 240422) TaxID=1213857 RepID=N4VVF6_COLOR|nr:hypothetical protein Cob_v002516 [Colletotrichum orbiculare MAFF 240422]
MKLCDLCKSLPLEDLPPFPDDKFMRTLSGFPRFTHLMLKGYKDGARIEPFGVQYHPSLEDLRKAASEGCALCEVVEKEADALLDEVAGIKPPITGALEWKPGWDMWLTKRGESGGDGLWVVCRSDLRGDGCIVPVAAIGFASDEDDPRSAGFSDRVLKEVPDQTTLKRITNWLDKCDQHPHCRTEGGPMPTRLLDVGTKDSGSLIRLVEPDPKLCDRYITLSYCWGDAAKHFTTTSETIHARKEGIKIEDLPRTFQDAVVVTRTVGVQYLWIDSLCICQDDLKDWERESAQMAAVYSNAYLTLAAAKSDNTQGGLLSARKSRSYFRLPREASDTNSYITASVLPLDKEVIHDYHLQMREDPLTKRAWGFQERVLSRRVLHFATEQLYWECIEEFQAEEGLRMDSRLHHFSDDQEVTDYMARRGDAGARSIDQTLAADISRPDVMRKWYELLWEYGPREMTEPADKFPAISGIAKVLAKKLDDEYLAGWWRSCLIESLCWQPLRGRAVDGYRAPSWSWGAVDGIPAAGFLGEAEHKAKVIEAKVDIDGENPFGRVKDGWIKLEAPLIKLKLTQDKGLFNRVLYRSEKGSGDFHALFDAMDRSFEKSKDVVEALEVYALVMAFTYGGPRGSDPERKRPVAHGILVVPAADRDGCMRRIGAFVQEAEGFGPEELAAETTVTIV